MSHSPYEIWLSITTSRNSVDRPSILAIFVFTVYAIWISRNEVVFNETFSSLSRGKIPPKDLLHTLTGFHRSPANSRV